LPQARVQQHVWSTRKCRLALPILHPVLVSPRKSIEALPDWRHAKRDGAAGQSAREDNPLRPPPRGGRQPLRTIANEVLTLLLEDPYRRNTTRAGSVAFGEFAID
jgi:hypothetical protein